MCFRFIYFFLLVFELTYAQSDSIENKLVKCKDNFEKAEVLAKVSSSQAGKNVDQSIQYANKALHQLGSIKNTRSAKIASGLYRTLALNYYYNGNNDSSLEYAEKALLIGKKLKDPKEIADSYLSMEVAYREMGRYEKAIEVTSLALKHYENDKNLSGQAKATLYIGILFDDQKQPIRALEYLNKAKLLFYELKDTAQLANAITRVGNVYKDTRSHDTAKVMYLEALKLFESIHHKRGVAVIYNNLAGLSEVFNSSEALKYYDLALKARTELGDKVSVCMIYSNIGAVNMNEKKYEKAIMFLNKGLEIAQEIDSKQNLLNLYHSLAGCYKKTNRLKQALEMQEKYSILKDTLFSQQSIERIEEIQTKYETEKKEQEILLLNNTNSLKELEISKNRTEISKQNQEKIIIALALAFFVIVSIIAIRSYQLTKKAKEIISEQKKEVEHQKNLVEEHQRETISSINYAKRIQYTLLANSELLNQNLKEHFVLFKPKDIVSGDFYWATKKDNKFYLAVCDSTGHGVPGAFMSLLNISFLNEAITEKNILEPHQILNHVRKRLIENISQEGGQDGMDAILFCFEDHSNSKTITYSAANNAPFLIRGGVIIELPKDKMPVGKGEKTESFTLQHISANKGDVLYLYTDGYADQFGGPKGKKFKYKALNELLLANCSKEPQEQLRMLNQNFSDWRGDLEQVDDVCLIGIKI